MGYKVVSGIKNGGPEHHGWVEYFYTREKAATEKKS
jgi:hypothetical protein